MAVKGVNEEEDKNKNNDTTQREEFPSTEKSKKKKPIRLDELTKRQAKNPNEKQEMK